MLDECPRDKPSYDAGTCMATWGNFLHMKPEAKMLFSRVTNELVVKLNWFTIINYLLTYLLHAAESFLRS